MNRSPRRFRAVPVLACCVALVMALAGCEEDTKPIITKLSATPQCGTIEDIPPGQFGNATSDTLRYLLVTFFGRAASGNSVSDPTGANSPLQWRWDLDGDGNVDATNEVSPTFRYTQTGDFTARLEVEDEDGDKVSKTIVIQVREESTDLDTLYLVAESRSEFRLTQLGSLNNSLDSEGEVIPLEDLPLDERFVFDSQQRLDGWAAVLDGQLTLGCTVAELFSQFDWTWTTSSGATVNDLNPLRIPRSTSDFDDVTGTVTVRELVTGVERSDSTVAPSPAGVLVRNGIYFTIAPDVTTDIDVLGLMLRGIDQISFGVEYDPNQLTAEVWNADLDLVAAGFTATATLTAPGRLDFSFTGGSALADPSPTLQLARITFRTADDELELPALRAMRVRDVAISRNGVTPPIQNRDGFIRVDVADCNDNDLGDTMELTARGDFIDQTREGVIDYCADCDANGTKDGEDILAAPLRDIDSNSLLDDCDCNTNGSYDATEIGRISTDDDGNGKPDDCDCDWNGLLDLDELREHPTFVPVFDGVTGLVTSYTVDIDQLGGSADLTLDFCQDCDGNLVFDSQQITILQGDSEAAILAKAKLDIDRNNKIDDCDCDGDDRFDRGQLERQDSGLGPIVDGDGNGEIDACDCDDNGEIDIREISAGILTFDDLKTSIRPGSATLVSGYRSNVDVNGDLELDRCADCDANSIPDGQDIAEERRRDIDVNGMPDVCDCDSNDEYDEVPIPEQDVNGDGITDACDCDLNGVRDLQQIAFDASTVLIFAGTEVVGYTSDVDAVTADMGGTMIAGNDLQLDLCQDCDENGTLDQTEITILDDDAQSVILTKLRRNLNQDNKLDACDCNRNRLFDVTEIAADPAIDQNSDGLIDDCDCNQNGINDLTEMAATATFDIDQRIYLGSDLDQNVNFILDECEGSALLAPPAGTERAARR